jgi:uncharacterized membrane protein YeaQ/YmgE (transglycosylase-associated protein family)
MGIIYWLIMGGLVGLCVNFLIGSNSDAGLGTNIIFGVLGGMIGGYALNLSGLGGAEGLNLWSILAATFGALILLLIVNALMKKKY